MNFKAFAFIGCSILNPCQIDETVVEISSSSLICNSIIDPSTENNKSQVMK